MMMLKVLAQFSKMFIYLTLVQIHITGEHCPVVRLADLENQIQNQKETIEELRKVIEKIINRTGKVAINIYLKK